MAALPSLGTALNQADTANQLVNKYVVSPVVGLGIAGFAFDIFEEHKVELISDITDHFVEDNSAIQDHIANKPLKFTLRGFVGEVIEEKAEPKSDIQELTEKLTTINSYIPAITGAARQVNDLIKNRNTNSTAENVSDAVGTGVDLFKTFKELNPPDSRQAKAYNFFKALRDAKQLLGVDTPFGFVRDMAIENLTAVQSDNAYITDFAVTLKQIRTAKTQLVDFDKTQYQGRANNQKAEEADQGKAEGVKVRSASLLKTIVGKFQP